MCIYLKNNAARFRHNPIWNDRALGFLEECCPKKKNKKIPHTPRSVVRDLIPCRPLSLWGWNPIKLAYKLAGWLAELKASAFNQKGRYANIHRADQQEEDEQHDDLWYGINAWSKNWK